MDGVPVCVHVHARVEVRLILSPLVVFCKSLSHPKPVLLSDDLIDLHESVWGTVKTTKSSGETGEKTAPSSFKIRRGTEQSHLNKKNVPFLLGGGGKAPLILHTIGASLHLSHCRIEIALSHQRSPQAHLPR